VIVIADIYRTPTDNHTAEALGEAPDDLRYLDRTNDVKDL